MVAQVELMNRLPQRPTDYFSDAEWSALCAQLEPVAKQLAEYARAHGLQFRTETRWPLARVERRRGIQRTSIGLELSPEFSDSPNSQWLLVYQRWSRLWLFYYKLHKVETLAHFPGSKLGDAKVIAAVLAQVALLLK